MKLHIHFDMFLEEQGWGCVCEPGKHCTLLVQSRHSIKYTGARLATGGTEDYQQDFSDKPWES